MQVRVGVGVRVSYLAQETFSNTSNEANEINLSLSRGVESLIPFIK